MEIEHKVALITGGSSGIGLALAGELAARQARVFIAGRDSDRLQSALSSLPPSSTGPHAALQADVSDPAQTQRLVESVLAQAGRLDVLVNSAGVVHPGYVQEMPLERFRWMMDINYFGTVYTTKAALPCMLEQHSGHIVNIGSFVSRVSVIGYSAYAPSKFAVRGFSDALRMEMKPYGIGVSIVYPPDTATPQLAYENQHKPPELKYLLPELGVIPAGQVARAIVRGIQRNRYEITADWGSRFLIYLDGLAGRRRYPVLDLLLARARRHTARRSP